MVVKSHGPRRRTREKFRIRGKISVNRLIKKFNVGDKVVIDIVSSSLSGIPFKRFQGLIGNVIEKRGNAYLIEIKDGNKTKKILATPEHLKTL